MQKNILNKFNCHTATKLTEFLDFYEHFFDENISIYAHHSYYYGYSCLRILKKNYYTITYELENSSKDLFRQMIIELIKENYDKKSN